MCGFKSENYTNYAIMCMISISFCFIFILYLEFILRIVSSLFISLKEGKFVLSYVCDFSVEMCISASLL